MSSSARRTPVWMQRSAMRRRAASPYGVGFIKNKYVGRTFIQGSQAQRESSVRIKLNAISSTVKGKRVVLVDDSIVRGTDERPHHPPAAARPVLPRYTTGSVRRRSPTRATSAPTFPTRRT